MGGCLMAATHHLSLERCELFWVPTCTSGGRHVAFVQRVEVQWVFGRASSTGNGVSAGRTN